MKLDATQRRLLRTLIRKWDLNLVILYGSQARGSTHRESDFDIAVRSRRALTLRQTLSLATQFDRVVRGEAEIVDLRAASPILLAAIARDGVLWFQQATSDFAQFRISAINQYLDFKPSFDRMMRRVNNEIAGLKV
jgi:uncharacterized protein